MQAEQANAQLSDALNEAERLRSVTAQHGRQLGELQAALIDAVLREPGRNWSIAQLAHRAAMSRATFIRHFGHGTGMTVGDFLTRLRMMIAADMLASGDQPVSAIASAVGYRSTSAFGRAFRAATATTPARFRSHANAAARTRYDAPTI